MAGEADAPWWWAGISLFLGAIGLAYQQFIKGRTDERKPQHLILEGAEVADMQVMRDLARQFGPALERLTHIDALTAQALERQQRVEHQIRELLDKLERMERAAEVAKGIREGLARRVEEQERRSRLRLGPDED